jgi:hypothetical protein
MATEKNEIEQRVFDALIRKSAPFSRELALSQAGFSLGPHLSIEEILEEIASCVSNEELERRENQT